MDDEEVAGQVELLDDGQLVLDLAPHSGRERRSVALARAAPRELAQAAGLGLARRERILGEVIAEVL